MADRHYVAVYWGDRAVPLDGCIAEVRDCLRRLAGHSELFARFYPIRATREESLAAELNEDHLRAAAEASVATSGDARYGYTINLWNGLDEARSVRAEITVGADIGLEFCPAPNSFALKLPRALHDPATGALVRREPLTRLLEELARAWSADWGTVSTEGYLLGTPALLPPHHPRVGWITFLHRSRGKLPRLPSAVVTRIDGAGVIVAAPDDCFTLDASGAIDRVRGIEHALAEAGLLRPTGTAAPSPADAPADDGDASALASALAAASAIDAIATRIPSRRADLSDTLLRAATALVVALSAGDDAAARVRELRALLDLTEKLWPAAEDPAVQRARVALAAVAAIEKR